MDNNIIEKRLENIDVEDYGCDDIGAGNLFVAVYRDYVKYLASEKEYKLYEEKTGVWKSDTKEQINEMAKELVSKYLPEMVENIEDTDTRNRYLRWLRNLQFNAGMGNLLRAARSDQRISAHIRDFDKNSRYLNLQNVVFDTGKGKMKPHHPRYMHSKCSNIILDPDAEDDTWEEFLLAVMNDDEEMYNYLLRIIAYTMLGRPKHNVMFLLYGPSTRNGKSTTANALLDLFGDYGITIQPQTLAKQSNRNSSGPSSDIARIKGSRYINVAELPNNLDLDAAKIKKYVGGDPITARYLHKEFFSFVNQGVFFMHTNHLPNVDDPTLFTSGRVIIIPFDARFTEGKGNVDYGMLKKLKREKAKSAFFNELLTTMEENKDINPKLEQPSRVKAMTKKYVRDADPFQYFIDTNIREELGDWVPTAKIAERYNAWASKKDYHSLSTKAVTDELKKRGYHRKRKNIGVGFADIRLGKSKKRKEE